MKSPKPSIAIAGSTGFLGEALMANLRARGCSVKRLIRTQPHQDTSREVYWNPESGHIERVGLEGVDVLINLAGAPIAGHRWSDKQKATLLHSRVDSTMLLAKTISKIKKPPELFINASGVGFYGTQQKTVLDEASPLGSGFLAELSKEWENAAHEAENRGIRTAYLRTGTVLGANGGLLKSILPLFKMGLGGPLGDGTQILSWIALEDWISAVEHLIFQSKLSGPVNLVSPNPVSNQEFTQILAKTLNRPARIRVPARLISWLFGEMGRTLLLEGAAVAPKRLLDDKFEFAHPNLEQALISILKR